MITFFTTPKPNAFIPQYNALMSWKQAIDPVKVQVLLIGKEEGTETLIDSTGVDWIPDVELTDFGRPDLRALFDIAHANAGHPILAYVNSDIILFPTLIEFLDPLLDYSRFLLCTQRWNLKVDRQLDFDDFGWVGEMIEAACTRGEPHPRTGIDLFMYPKGMFTGLQRGFGVGHLAWDNYLPWYAVNVDKALFYDASAGMVIVHQNHDITDYTGHPGAGRNHALIRAQIPGGGYAGLFLDDAHYRWNKEERQYVPNWDAQ